MENQIQEIWIDFHQELKRFIQGKVKDLDTSNDILQDVFLKIHVNIHTLVDTSKLTSWVYQITRNTITDHFRKHHAAVEINDIDLAEQDYDEPLYASLSNCINLKISKLPEKYKQVILLTAFQDYSQIALADELGISYSGAKTRVQRAKEKLKEQILDCSNVELDSKGNILSYQSPRK
ncbi:MULTISPECIES: RNA polymerase sigma factor SigZ [unclassified Arcicella]|uniref:RNA polymerase sigma factor SigZ n=1 Tax=unclassified Arcicella TaxID=2644986 RepID=UPI0028653DE3|nr:MULTISPECIES: RNA polymerase sigma factor SigZ [unclassified Arcicella]MDR6563112.1 RNA polymerase sigma-70 factor (ECF subfamily) [Arcicella sp. BE51]MDR6811737.1 RNA polymerase sigma-70 factor (ECF subfamily) [Arcicella sp. BE140]MDR6823262.1 RNA polymerase sigma-70 factor (ECF subfamily) [Arcicella sp. BE139]